MENYKISGFQNDEKVEMSLEELKDYYIGKVTFPENRKIVNITNPNSDLYIFHYEGDKERWVSKQFYPFEKDKGRGFWGHSFPKIIRKGKLPKEKFCRVHRKPTKGNDAYTTITRSKRGEYIAPSDGFDEDGEIVTMMPERVASRRTCFYDLV